MHLVKTKQRQRVSALQRVEQRLETMVKKIYESIFELLKEVRELKLEVRANNDVLDIVHKAIKGRARTTPSKRARLRR